MQFRAPQTPGIDGLSNQFTSGEATVLADFGDLSGTQGDVIYFNGTNWVVLGAGTSGYYLKTQGAGANPVWASISAGTQTPWAQDIDAATYNLSDVTNIIVHNGGALRTSTTAADTLLLQAYDVDGAAYITFGTLTAGNTPSFTLSGATINTGLVPDANDGAYLGQSGTAFSDLFLASGAVINFNAGDVILTHSANALTLDGGDLLTASGFGIIIGSATKIATDNTAIFQVLGTDGAKGSMAIGRFANDANHPQLEFIKSRGATVGSATIVQDNDGIGSIHWHAADGTDFVTKMASFHAEVDDASPALNDIGTAFVWSSLPGGGGAFREVMRLSAAGELSLAVNNLILGTNSITMTGSLAATGARVTKGWFTDIESTNMPTVGGTSLSSTFAPIASPTFTGTVTLPTGLTGLAKMASGVVSAVTAPSGAVVGDTDTQTLSAKTLTAPKFADGGFLADNNGNEQLVMHTTASAVNQVEFTNAATGTAGPLIAPGGETNIDLKLSGKGTGAVHIVSGSYGDITSDTDGATVTFNLATSNIHKVTLGGNRTLALSNEHVGQVFMLRLLQDGTGTRTVTWFTTIKWAGGSAPTLTTTASKADVLGFVVTSSGNYDGFVIGQNL